MNVCHIALESQFTWCFFVIGGEPTFGGIQKKDIFISIWFVDHTNGHKEASAGDENGKGYHEKITF